MGRPAKHSVDFKARVVLSVLRGEMTGAEAARRHGVSETSIVKWKGSSLRQAALDCSGPAQRVRRASRRGLRRRSTT